jgi:hypothetical protein
MLASQLPEKDEDALIILRLTTQLVTDSLAGPEPTQKPTPNRSADRRQGMRLTVC